MTRNFEPSLTFKKTIKKTDFEVQHRFETEVFKQVSSTTSILEERKKLRENSDGGQQLSVDPNWRLSSKRGLFWCRRMDSFLLWHERFRLQERVCVETEYWVDRLSRCLVCLSHIYIEPLADRQQQQEEDESLYGTVWQLPGRETTEITERRTEEDGS